MTARPPVLLRHVALATLLAASPVWAQTSDRENLETLKQTTLNLIELLVQQGVLPADKADQMIRAAEAKARATVADAQQAEKNTVRVQYVPESLRKQITEQVREEVVAQAKAERWGDVNAVPEWVDRFKLEGDLRLGYQRDMFANGNAPEVNFQAAGQNIDNTLLTRDRTRLRARLGVTARVTPAIAASLRLATGNTTDPVSTNQTLGNTNNKYNFTLDRAFVRAKSDDFLPWLTTSAGRIPNPFFSTDLVWDDDLSFEGVAFHAFDTASAAKTWRPFATVGAFPLQDVSPSASNLAKSKWLVGAQAGVEWVPSNDMRAKVGMALYNYRNISGVRNTFGSTLQNDTAPKFRQKGNSVFDIDNDGNPTTNLFALSSDYRLINVTGALDITLSNPTHLMLTADYVRNIGFNQAKTLARTGAVLNTQTTGYMLRAALGSPEMLLKDDWQVSLAYRYLGADAVLDAFTDSDFHLGGTNNKGFIVGAQYGLGRNTWLAARWLSSREITGLPLSINTFQVNLNAKF